MAMSTDENGNPLDKATYYKPFAHCHPQKTNCLKKAGDFGVPIFRLHIDMGIHQILRFFFPGYSTIPSTMSLSHGHDLDDAFGGTSSLIWENLNAINSHESPSMLGGLEYEIL